MKRRNSSCATQHASKCDLQSIYDAIPSNVTYFITVLPKALFVAQPRFFVTGDPLANGVHVHGTAGSGNRSLAELQVTVVGVDIALAPYMLQYTLVYNPVGICSSSTGFTLVCEYLGLAYTSLFS